MYRARTLRVWLAKKGPCCAFDLDFTVLAKTCGGLELSWCATWPDEFTLEFSKL